MSKCGIAITLARAVTSVLVILLRPLAVVFNIITAAPSIDSVFLCLWVVAVSYFRSEILALDVGKINALIFVAAVAGVMWSEHIIRGARAPHVWNRNYVQLSLRLVIYISTPVVLLFYVWLPVAGRLPCLLRSLFGPYLRLLFTWRPLSVGVGGAMLTALVLRLLSARRKIPHPTRRGHVREQTTQTTPPTCRRRQHPLRGSPPRTPTRSPYVYAHTPITRSMSRMLRAQSVEGSPPWPTHPTEETTPELPGQRYEPPEAFHAKGRKSAVV